MLGEVIRYFLRLGFLGFGGPLALVAAIQKDLVENRKWIEPEKFQSSFALIKSMPGPIALMSAVYMGRVRAGALGGLAAGSLMIFPAFFLMLLLAIFIDKFEQSPIMIQALLGMQVAALAVILVSVKGIVRGFEKDMLFWFIAFLSFILNYFFSSWEPVIIIGFGVILALFSNRNSLKKDSFKKNFVNNDLSNKNLPRKSSKNTNSLKVFIFLFFALLIACPFLFADSLTASLQSFVDSNQQNPLLELIWVCFKAGAFVFGSGLAIVPMLQADVVDHYHWLTQSQFLNAVALGQVTPGPVLITSTAIGYHVSGVLGATIATFFIFFPSFFNMMTWFPRANDWLLRQTWIKSFSRGAIGAVAGSILFSILKISSQLDWKPSMLFLFFAVFLIGFKTKTPTWLLILSSSGFLLLFA